MNKRPRIKIALDKTDKFIEILGWIAVIAIWLLTLINYFDLPETIPTHYNASGEADGFGNKLNILTLPLISTLMYVGLTILTKHPHLLNYSDEINEDNALYQYKNATKMIRVLKLAVIIIFGLIVFKTIQTATGKANGLGIWFLPFMFGLLFIPVFYFSIKSNKPKN